MKKSIRVEAPREVGHETEFFLQEAMPHSLACTAHIHSTVELIYVNEGSYSVSLDFVHYELRKGDLILFCSDAIHSVVSGSEPRNSYYVIKIPPSFFINFSKRDVAVKYCMRFAFNKRERKCLWRSEELFGSPIKRLIDELICEYTEQNYASEVAIRLKTMELMIAILRDSEPDIADVNNRSAELIYNVMSFVQENYAEDINEKELSKSFGMSYSYFSRSFKQVTGMTFKSYLNRTRISKAEQLLFKSNSSISEIATACGYNSISYFISVYRSLTGNTPYQAMSNAAFREKLGKSF